MSTLAKAIRHITQPLVLVTGLGLASQSFACGGFFCELIPIDQAAEQIVFRQDGDQTTAMIKIDYVGNAEDFGWVLPVPNTPEISLGSDQIFTQLEIATRPQFLLDRVGTPCPIPIDDRIDGSGVANESFSSSGSSDSGVTIEQTLSVGPFDALVISSDDESALATWLTDNNLNLTDQGGTLLKPYIEAKSKFVVLKLKNSANTGSIQPVILKYESSAPVIPMTLTAVAAQDDMGVLVWLLNDSRGVPKNYHHVIPNYSRLNWFSGTRNGYASYQNLVTQAMNEAGGQGFATDFAGLMPNLPASLDSAELWENLLKEPNRPDADFISDVWRMNATSVVSDTIRNSLPTSDSFVYSNPRSMEEVFTEEQLSQARTDVINILQERVITPTNAARDILDDNLYLTRLYTTLSGDEMTLNPEFTFNSNMPEQPLTRRATLAMECVNNVDKWTLTLGEGTGRDGELVAESTGFQPPVVPIVDSTQQEAAWLVQKTSADRDPVVIAKNDFEVVKQEAEGSFDGDTNKGSNGDRSSGSLSFLGMLSLGLMLLRRRLFSSFKK